MLSGEQSGFKLLNFYINHLEKDLLPFWLRAVDKRNGGIFTCFDNSGSKLLSENKYTWSQGRFLWIWSRIARLISENKLHLDASPFHEDLHKTVEFMEEHVFLGNGNCAFLLSNSGEKLKTTEGEGYDISFYADCFVVLGLSEYAGYFRDRNRYDEALTLYHNIEKRIKEGKFRSEPFPIPDSYKAFAVPMIMLNVVQQLADVAQILNHREYPDLFRASVNYMREIMEDFCLKNYRITEMFYKNPSLHNTLLTRHVNPGHTIEAMGFVMHTAVKYGNLQVVDKATKVIEKAFEIGWDQEFGGIYHYVDKNGGKPTGDRGTSAYETSIEYSWDTKLWWVHAEVLYSTMLAFKLTRSENMRKLYDKIHSYTFNVFPNSDKKTGEWIQIRDRRGNPINKVVALPVKDPFHIIRSTLLMIDLLIEPLDQIRE